MASRGILKTAKHPKAEVTRLRKNTVSPHVCSVKVGLHVHVYTPTQKYLCQLCTWRRDATDRVLTDASPPDRRPMDPQLEAPHLPPEHPRCRCRPLHCCL